MQFYRLIPVRSPAAEPPTAAAPQTDATLENEHYRLKLDPAGGAIAELIVKKRQLECPARPRKRRGQGGRPRDLWELYRRLDGACRVPEQGALCPALNRAGDLQQRAVRRAGTVRSGPVVSEFEVAHPLGERDAFRTRVRLCAGQRRIEIRTTILNQDKFRSLPGAVSTAIPKGQNVNEIPFGAIQRPEGVEFAPRTGATSADRPERRALLNPRIAGNNAADGTIMLSLAAAPISTGTAWQDLRFRLRVGKGADVRLRRAAPRRRLRQAAVYREAWSSTTRFWSALRISHPEPCRIAGGCSRSRIPTSCFSALKTSEDGQGVVLRVYEAAGMAAGGVKIAFSAPVASAKEVNLMEDPGPTIELAANALQVDLRPFEIKTIKCELHPPERPPGKGNPKAMPFPGSMASGAIGLVTPLALPVFVQSARNAAFRPLTISRSSAMIARPHHQRGSGPGSGGYRVYPATSRHSTAWVTPRALLLIPSTAALVYRPSK